MWTRAFLNRLRRELPGWVEQGWVSPDHETAILDHVTAQAGKQVRKIPVALAVMGVLTFGVGVITYFAANWDGMSKLVKLVLLFGGLWGAYASAAWSLTHQSLEIRVLGHALMLLGVILFGANIMLIAQIYHIDSHYPNGVLMWTLGALAVAYVVPVQVTAVAGLALAVLWSGMEIFDFDRTLHWPFLVVWGLFLPPILRGAWRYGAVAAMLALLAWGLITLLGWSYELRDEEIFLIQVYLLVAMTFYLLGTVMDGFPRVAPVSPIVRRFALVGLLLCAHTLVYESFYGLPLLREPESTWGVERLAAAPAHWVIATVVALAAALGLAAWHLRRGGERPRVPLTKMGLGLLVAAGALMLVNLVLPRSYGPVMALYITMNLVAFAGLIWLIVAGYRAGDRFQVNAAFLFFAFGLLALYFDRFWTLMDRSLFFMGGGALLFLGGYLLERQRRRLLGQIAGSAGAEGAP